MSLKAELEIWASALAAYDAEKFDEAIELFSVSTCPHPLRGALAVGLDMTLPGNVENRRIVKNPHEHGPHLRHRRRPRDCGQAFPARNRSRPISGRCILPMWCLQFPAGAV